MIHRFSRAIFWLSTALGQLVLMSAFTGLLGYLLSSVVADGVLVGLHGVGRTFGTWELRQVSHFWGLVGAGVIASLTALGSIYFHWRTVWEEMCDEIKGR